jgi:hypothetical protein
VADKAEPEQRDPDSGKGEPKEPKQRKPKKPRKRSKPGEPSNPSERNEPRHRAPSWLPAPLRDFWLVNAGQVRALVRGFWIVTAGLYLATVWVDGIGSNWPAKMTPRPWLYFSQIAALFVNAAPKVFDYRAEGWSCRDHRWVEVDVRPYFRIDADNKENRFQRALQFYRQNRTVMRALEDFIVKRHNATGANIGGVRFSSLRLPYPAPGAHVDPFEQKPLSTYGADVKKDWYWTPTPRRTQRCGHPDGDGTRDDDSDRPRDQGSPKDPDGRELDP